MEHRACSSRKDLVVVVACTVLALMSLGAIGSGGRRRAKEAVCLSNLRQWGVMFEMFTNDNGGYFMEGFAGSASGNNRWIKALGAYHNYDTNVSCCPEAATPWIDEYGQSTGLPIGGAFMAWGYVRLSGWARPFKGSYGINGWCNNPEPGRSPGGKPGEFHWRTPNVSDAAGVPLFFGMQRYNAWPEHNDLPPAYDGQSWADSGQMTRVCMNRHHGAVNGLFLDFSARKVGLRELWTLKWHRSFSTEGPWTKAGGAWPEDWPEWMRDFKEY
ncbi:MAG: hypothetical protein JSU70_00065 [Phycisphaerales bacterium]|nr:MAG: hypothetical protein JSU70_00065 [Phycisphaerales bacterium]